MRREFGEDRMRRGWKGSQSCDAGWKRASALRLWLTASWKLPCNGKGVSALRRANSHRPRRPFRGDGRGCGRCPTCKQGENPCVTPDSTGCGTAAVLSETNHFSELGNSPPWGSGRHPAWGLFVTNVDFRGKGVVGRGAHDTMLRLSGRVRGGPKFEKASEVRRKAWICSLRS